MVINMPHAALPSPANSQSFLAFNCILLKKKASQRNRTRSSKMAKIPILLVLHSLLLFFVSVALSRTVTLTNNCGYTVWPGFSSKRGNLETTWFALEAGKSRSLNAPANWKGRVWGRTLCSTDSVDGFTCVTGDCEPGTAECSGGGVATVAEFTLDGFEGMDFYDVSLVDGYNLPMLVTPQEAGSGGNCSQTGCPVDLNGVCPSALKVVVATANGENESVACKSACLAFGSPQYCCNGTYACKPSSYSQFFKKACPQAYSYALDDPNSTLTCYKANYLITFCPGTTRNSEAAPGLLVINTTMVFLSGDQASGSRARGVLLLMTLAVVAASWLLPRHL